MPPDTENVEGYSDENLIRLDGESAVRFHALLSVIYDMYVSALSFHNAQV